jgi:hypothetical protein
VLFLVFVLLSASAFAADWIDYRSGLFHVISNGGDRPARDRLNEMEQLRHVLGNMLGKNDPLKGGVETVWPVEVVLFANAKEYGPHSLRRPFVEGGSAILSSWSADSAFPRDWLRTLTRQLIEDNAGRMPEVIETALCDLFSTIQVNGTRVMLGAPFPPGELPAIRIRAWAKMQMLMTNPEYATKVRVYLNNLQQGGDEALATRNAFGMTPAQLDAQVDAYLRAGGFAPAPASGEALSPSRDFIEKPVDKAAMDALLAELAAAGKTFPPDSARGLVAKGTHPALELAAKANPRWAEPHFRLAALETTPAAKIKELKTAATLEPRNSAYWQALAEAQIEADQYADAAKSWAAAERAAPTDADRVRVRQTHADFEDRRAEFELAEKRRIAEEKARDLQRIKDSAAAEVHAAEQAANNRLGPGADSAKAAIPWFGDPPGEKLSGTLARVDCLNNGPMRLTINIDGGGNIRLLIRDPNKLMVRGAAETRFACGVQRPARKLKVIYTVKADAKLDAVGEIAMVEFP